MRKYSSALLVTAALYTTTQFAQATGIPTFDLATVMQLQQQFTQMKKDYDMLKKQYDSVTGSYGRGAVGMNDSIKSSSVVPGSWQEVVAQQKSGMYGTRQGEYEKLIKTLPQDLFRDPKSQDATSYKLSTDSVRAAMSGGEVLYGEVQVHLNNLARLSQMVDSTTNIKDAQDLQNRISTENGMMQTAMGKLNAMNMNLQANMLNQQNQATSANQQYFQWKSK
jgi:type IV secretion system protein VirB5